MNNRNLMTDYLKEKRKAAHLSQADVAKALGYTSAQFISNWERGVSLPPVDTLRKLAGLYQVPENEMLEKMIEVSLAQVRMDLERKFKNIV